jgi:hypothetical protein
LRVIRAFPSTRAALAITSIALGVGLIASSGAAVASTGGVGSGGASGSSTGKPGKARLRDGKAIPPSNAPKRIRDAIAAGNRIRHKPYRWGGGHGAWEDRGYDCSGTVSYILHAANMLKSPRDSGQLRKWGRKGKGRWITVMANGGHTYIVVAGLRMDTSGTGGKGPRWHNRDVYTRSNGPFSVRHYSNAY